MPAANIALLPDRGVISVTGADAGKLLQGLITNDIDALEQQQALHAGLLSPQGKILFDFQVLKGPGGFLLDVASEKAADLVKRLTIYKLRADAVIADVSGQFRVLTLWGPDRWSPGETAGTISFDDPRHRELGRRILAEAAFASDIASASNGHDCNPDDYHAHRIALGVPEGGKDYAFGDTFPHEALFDQLQGVSFTKGCYVGQEIVSRMEHRGTARKRIVPVTGAVPLTPGCDITAGDVAIGTLGSVAGSRGLAMIRLDRAAEFRDKGVGLTASGVPIAIELPPWATFELDPRRDVEPA